jgi:translocation protein SEC63
LSRDSWILQRHIKRTNPHPQPTLALLLFRFLQGVICSLTDDEIRRNYQEYGHPDGKQEYSIGIALPKWIVESSNGYFVLAFYGLLFGVLLPAVVGRWWYGSQNLTKEGIETETAARYFRAVREYITENDVVDILATSHEFEKVPKHPHFVRIESDLQYLTTNDRINKINSVILEKKLAQANIPLTTQYPHVARSEVFSPSFKED